MIVRQYAPCNLGRNTICLGKQGEINALRVEFDVSAWMAMYPDATVKLMHFAPDRPQDNPVIPTMGVEGTTRVWIVGEDDTANAGNGVIELLLIDERTGSTIKSATGYTTVLHSPSAGIETQEAEAGYVRYDVDQSALLTDEQKAVARKNIGAGTGDGTGSGTGGITEETDPTVPDWAKQPSKPTYTASEVGARPDSWTPSASDVGADAAGTALAQVGAHNVSGEAHADLRALIEGLTSRLNALADSDDETLDQLSEIVAYIKSNKALIDAVTTGKVSTGDIVDNLTTNASGKVLSAAQGVKLKALIDAIVIPDKLPNPQPLTINGQSYDGSEAVEVNVAAEGGGSTVELDTTLTQSGKAADAKVVGDKLSELNDAKAQKADKRGYYMHISFDDVETCVGNLASGDYASIWDEPLFGWLKGLHEQYGAKFSLYVYNISQLSSVPDTYKPELMAASDWLKFGLHSNTTSGTYGSSTYAAGQTDWNTVVNQVVRFAGSHKSIDRIPRLNYFEGTLNALKGMRDAECGALGFLCSDAERDSYYLSADQNAYLRTHDHLIDFANGLLFYQTDMRGDWFKSGFTSAYEYDTPTADNVYDELVRRFATPKYADTYQSLIWFAHEWQFYSGTTLNDYKVWTEDACRFAYDYGIPFDYPQNRIGINPTSFQFLSVTSSEDTTIETTGISLDKSTLSFTLSESQTLIATVEPSDSTQAVTWESSDNGVATVSGGIVNPVANGSCTITATSGAYSASCDVTVNIAESGGEETGTFLLSDYVTFEVGTGGYYTSADTYKLNINNARLSANIKPVEFAVGDVIDIGDYETYDCAIGTNEASTSANNRMWINGGYLGAPYTLVEADLLDAWVILIKRNDGANISQTDIDYINANAKVIRNA